jgi:hypothetical protein
MTTSERFRPVLLASLLAAMTFAQGCRAIEGIFKAGFVVGIALAVIVAVVVFGLVKAIGN